MGNKSVPPGTLCLPQAQSSSKKIKLMRTEGFPAIVSPASVHCNTFCI